MDNRPDPDQLLKQIQTEDSNRGKLKIFFGAVAGVGKTYTMLAEAKQRMREGVDVVIGIVETHKRAETQALLEGFEFLPMKAITYKNVEVKEFDLEAALKRRPTLILVDELAHSNAPGSRHAKRWQDVEELLEAGINVYTTLNVQHCESVNDVIAQITRVLVRETVPDAFIEKADEIKLVDISTEELLKRLKEGKVYVAEQAQLAAQNFFRLGNLIALRQLALKYTSRSVDSKLRAYKDVNAISTVWKVGEHFLVCVSASPRTTKIIRAAKQIASDLGAQWTVAYAETVSIFSRKAAVQNQVSETMRFAEKMGAGVVTLSGENIADVIISYARSKNISKIIVGKPGRLRWQDRLFGSFIDELAHKCGEIDLYLISGEEAEEPAPPRRYEPFEPFPWRGLVTAVFISGFCTFINKLLVSYLVLADFIMIYLLGVAWLAFRYGQRISIIGTMLSAVFFDFLFVPPLYSFPIIDKRHLVNFSVVMIVGLIIGNTAGRFRRQTVLMQAREERTQTLYSLSRDLAQSSRPDDLFQILLSHVRDVFKSPAVILTVNAKDKTLHTLTATVDGRPLAAKELAVATWVFEHRKIAGQGTETFSGSEGLYVPLAGSRDIVGVLGLFSRDEKQLLNPDNFHILEMFAKQAALAVEDAQTVAENIQTETELDKTRLLNMILETTTYDVKSYLSVISKSASELLNADVVNDSEKRNALIKEILKHADQLEALTAELPKIIDEMKRS